MCKKKLEGEGGPSTELCATHGLSQLNFFATTDRNTTGGRGSVQGSPSPSIFHAQYSHRRRGDPRKTYDNMHWCIEKVHVHIKIIVYAGLINLIKLKWGSDGCMG